MKLGCEAAPANKSVPAKQASKMFYHMTRTARSQFPWKTIRKKVPYEGRTRRSDRAGKTRTALLEMRTALLETAAAKSSLVNEKTILLLPKFVFSKMSHESEHSQSEFYYLGELSRAELLH